MTVTLSAVAREIVTIIDRRGGSVTLAELHTTDSQLATRPNDVIDHILAQSLMPRHVKIASDEYNCPIGADLPDIPADELTLTLTSAGQDAVPVEHT